MATPPMAPPPPLPPAAQPPLAMAPSPPVPAAAPPPKALVSHWAPSATATTSAAHLAMAPSPPVPAAAPPPKARPATARPTPAAPAMAPAGSSYPDAFAYGRPTVPATHVQQLPSNHAAFGYGTPPLPVPHFQPVPSYHFQPGLVVGGEERSGGVPLPSNALSFDAAYLSKGTVFGSATQGCYSGLPQLSYNCGGLGGYRFPVLNNGVPNFASVQFRGQTFQHIAGASNQRTKQQLIRNSGQPAPVHILPKPSISNMPMNYNNPVYQNGQSVNNFVQHRANRYQHLGLMAPNQQGQKCLPIDNTTDYNYSFQNGQQGQGSVFVGNANGIFQSDMNVSDKNAHAAAGSSNGYYYGLMCADEMTSGQGSMQQLLRSVCMGTKDYEQERPSEDGKSACTAEDESNNEGSDNDQNRVAVENAIECGEDDEYHENDDECVADDEAENYVMPDLSSIEKNQGNQIEFEVVQLDEKGKLLGKKRRHFPRGYVVPGCREPRDIGTIEKAMRNGPDPVTKHIFEPKLGMVFDSRAEIYKFYNMYSWEVGFGIRFGGFAENRVNKMRTMQELVCEKEGYDKRLTKNSNRMRCKAMVRLHRTEDFGWYVSKHVTTHNHPLSTSCGEKREWNSHSKIEECTKRMIRYLRECNVSQSKVHLFMGNMYGGMDSVPFNPKSVRSVCSEVARDQKSDDIAKTFEVFRQMRKEDPGFQFSVDLDEEKKVRTLLWTSGRSRAQYHFFGDAITFDTTYCTNIYKMPFGMFVGVNNHFQSVLFAGVLMTKEDTASFKWVFTEFITLMGGKIPGTILTDQCKAMTKAIKEVFPEWTVHLWCKWHVLRDAPQELGPLYRKSGPFRRDFHYVISQMLTIDEFEKGWEDLLKTYNLQDNEFMKRTYEKREKWAKPWARDIFCARMASTQRSESANSILKKVVPRNSSMNRFVEQYSKMLFMRKRAEEKAEHQTKQFVHRSKRMYAIEKHAISVYTKNCFQLFSEEVDKATDYIVHDGDDDNTYYVIHNNASTRKHWARCIFKVEISKDGSLYCECGQYEHFGILCCHSIKVLIDEGINEIPEGNIMKRWTRNARDYEYPNEVCTSAGEQLGQSLLFANALDVVNSTEKDPIAGQILTKHLNMARKEIEDRKRYMSESDGKSTSAAYITETGTDTEYGNETEYDTDGPQVIKNRYGASGSSAYMSDADVNSIQAPNVPKERGRKRETRFKPIFERKRKSRKKYTAESWAFERIEEETDINNCNVSKPERKKKPRKNAKKAV